MSLEQDFFFFTFYRKLQLSDSWTEPRWVTKVNVTLAASANLFLWQTCEFTNAACWKKNMYSSKRVLPAQGHIMTQRVITTVYCFIVLLSLCWCLIFGFNDIHMHVYICTYTYIYMYTHLSCSLFRVWWSKGWHIILDVSIAREIGLELAAWTTTAGQTSLKQQQSHQEEKKGAQFRCFSHRH